MAINKLVGASPIAIAPAVQGRPLPNRARSPRHAPRPAVRAAAEQEQPLRLSFAPSVPGLLPWAISYDRTRALASLARYKFHQRAPHEEALRARGSAWHLPYPASPPGKRRRAPFARPPTSQPGGRAHARVRAPARAGSCATDKMNGSSRGFRAGRQATALPFGLGAGDMDPRVRDVTGRGRWVPSDLVGPPPHSFPLIIATRLIFAVSPRMSFTLRRTRALARPPEAPLDAAPPASLFP